MRQRGFTIIETSLFLAISGALILLVVGLWTMVARQRFQDTMTTLKSVVQAEYEEVRSNINERLGSADVKGCDPDGVNATGNSKCLAVGKYIKFSGGDVKISYVVATEAANEQFLNMSDEAALRSMTLKVISDSSSYDVRSSDPAILPKNVKIEWGGEFIKGWTIADPTIATDSIAILHSPIGGAVLVFTFRLNPLESNGLLKLDTRASASQSIALMIKNGQVGFKGAALCIDSGSSSSAVQTAIPADSFYNFGANASTYVPNYTDLRSLCSL